MYRVLPMAAVACLSMTLQAAGQTVLTREETLARARQAGSVAVSRARVTEAEAGIRDAMARFRENPTLEVNAGPRSRDSDRTVDASLSVAQQLETGGQRRARIAGAQARVERQRAEVDDAARSVVFDAALTFLEGIAIMERLEILAEAERISRQLLAATERRYALGDIAAVDLNLARIAAARASATLRGARADLTAALGKLRMLLRLSPDEAIELRGSLDVGPPLPLAELESALELRPDLGTLAAEAREAEAQARLGRALSRPDLGVRFGWEREESATRLLGGVTIALPVFQRGQATLAGGLAAGNRVRLELETRRDAARAELKALYDAFRQRAELAAALVSDAMPSLGDNESLSQRSYEAGEMNLMDLLIIRRDALDTRTAIVDRRLDAARSRVHLDYVAGVLR